MPDENNGAGNSNVPPAAAAGSDAPGNGTGDIKPVVNDDGTVTIGDKTFIPKESYDVVAEKQRKANKELERIEKEKSDAEAKRLAEAGNFKELAEAEQKKRMDLEANYNRERKVNALKLAAMQEGTVDADAVATLTNLDGIIVSEDGTVDTSSVKSIVETLKKDKPYLFGTPNGNGGAQPPKPNIGSNGGAPNGGSNGAGGEGKTFYRSQLTDNKFYTENRAAILEAAREGRIVDDLK